MKKVWISLFLFGFLCLSSLFVSATEADLEFGFSAYSQEEYERYIEEEELYRSFIPYEKLSFLGEFASFHHGFSSYTYFFTVKNGERVRFDLKEGNHMGSPYSKIVEIDPPHEGTLLCLTLESKSFLEELGYQSCFFMVDDVQFTYDWNHFVDDMVLTEIRWYSAEKKSTYIIYLNATYREPIFTEDAFESGFYAEIENLSTWSEARTRLLGATGDMFCVSLSNNSADFSPYLWLWVGIGGGAAVVIGGAVAAALIVRKKRRNAAASSDPEGALTPDGL